LLACVHIQPLCDPQPPAAVPRHAVDRRPQLLGVIWHGGAGPMTVDCLLGCTGRLASFLVSWRWRQLAQLGGAGPFPVGRRVQLAWIRRSGGLTVVDRRLQMVRCAWDGSPGTRHAAILLWTGATPCIRLQASALCLTLSFVEAEPTHAEHPGHSPGLRAGARLVGVRPFGCPGVLGRAVIDTAGHAATVGRGGDTRVCCTALLGCDVRDGRGGHGAATTHARATERTCTLGSLSDCTQSPDDV
jgi:hypothetical protein